MESNQHQELTGWAARHIEKLETQIAGQREEMNRDFEHFFKWHSTDLVQLLYEKDEYETLAKVLEGQPAEQAIVYISATISRIERQLLNANPYARTTNPLHNLANECQILALQEVRREFVGLLYNLNRNDSE